MQAKMKQTIILKLDPEHPDIEKIRTAAAIIKEGGLVAFPTETVYGLGADALNTDAVLSLFKAKNRPLDNPPIVHIEETSDVYKLSKLVTDKAKVLMEHFWPGPLTLVFERSQMVPDVTTAGLDTIAIRMPNHNVALSLIEESGRPIAAPSANLAGRPSPTSAEHVLHDLYGKIDAILDGGPARIGLESTVLDVSVDPPVLLRPGGVSFETLQKIIGEVYLHPFVTTFTELSASETRSPGMKHRHYAPKAQMILIEGPITAMMAKVKELTSIYWLNDKRVGVLATDETSWAYEADVVKSLGSRRNVDAMAPNLFRLLREFDYEKVDVILAEGVPTDDLGLALMNRLRKASGYNIIRVG
jgi:L-threonylcarbamoyladenylate synthase